MIGKRSHLSLDVKTQYILQYNRLSCWKAKFSTFCKARFPVFGEMLCRPRQSFWRETG